MNRRTLLKGATATGALGALGMRRTKRSSAARRVRIIQNELPLYELISIFVSGEFVLANGQSWRGIARDINNDGVILGDIVQNGLMAPVTWDASLSMTMLDTGPFSDLNITPSGIDDIGTIYGFGLQSDALLTEAQSQGVTFDVPTIVWSNGAIDTQMSGAWGPDSGITSLTSDGEFLGMLDNLPTFWSEGVPEPLVMPAEFVTGGYRSANQIGDRAGSMYRAQEPFTGGVPFVRTAAGDVVLLEPPLGNSADWQGRVQAYSLADDGSLAALVRGETDLFGVGVRYRDGAQTPIADLNGEGLHFNAANAEGVLIGQSLLNGISIPTMWIDDQPMMIADLIIPGPDLLLLEVSGINDLGAIVGTAQDSEGMYHHVLLRPV